MAEEKVFRVVTEKGVHTCFHYFKIGDIVKIHATVEHGILYVRVDGRPMPQMLRDIDVEELSQKTIKYHAWGLGRG